MGEFPGSWEAFSLWGECVWATGGSCSRVQGAYSQGACLCTAALLLWGRGCSGVLLCGSNSRQTYMWLYGTGEHTLWP